jgi:hypothetical protein
LRVFFHNVYYSTMVTTQYVRVYHLLSSNNAVSDITLKRLKISNYRDLNDPFELLCANLSNKDFRRALNYLKNTYFKHKGILCFSRSWENPVLWSHYANKHTGIALGFDIPIELACPVLYSPSRLAINHKELNERSMNLMLHTKFSHWAYEDEMRMHVLLNESTKENGKYFYNFDNSLILREVILGHSCTEDIDQMRHLVKTFSPSVKVLQARLAFKTFRVVTNQRHNIYK